MIYPLKQLVQLILVMSMLSSSAVAYAGINEDLLDAALEGDIAKVKILIDKGANVNFKDNEGRTALIYACKAFGGTRGVFKQQVEGRTIEFKLDHIDVAKALIEKGAYVNGKDEYGKTPMWYAHYLSLPTDSIDFIKTGVEMGKKDLIEYLNKKGGAMDDVTDSVYYIASGDAYFKGKQYDKSISMYTKALEISPRDILAYSSRGRTYMEVPSSNNVDEDKSIADFGKVLELNPNFTKFYELRGMIYVCYDDKEKGCPDLKRACKLGMCGAYKISREKGYCQ